MKITILILTNNRISHLKTCLNSISKQSTKPQKTIVIDNSQNQTAKTTTLSFNKRLNIEYLHHPKSNVPQLRNIAIKQVKTKYLAFIDDDCILDKNWLKNGISTTTNQKTPFIIGLTKLSNKNNLLAQAQYAHYSYWFQFNLKRNPPFTSPFNFDTKNIIIDKTLLSKHKIFFDPSICIQQNDSADTDLGLQLNQKNIYGKHNSSMHLFHQETSAFKWFLKKSFRRGRLAYLLKNKWKLENEFVDEELTHPINLIKHLKTIPSQYNNYKPFINSYPILVFMLIKLWETSYFTGFLFQKRIN